MLFYKHSSRLRTKQNNHFSLNDHAPSQKAHKNKLEGVLIRYMYFNSFILLVQRNFIIARPNE